MIKNYVEPLRMLPRFDENQSAEVEGKTNSQTQLNSQSNKADMKAIERTYDRSGKNCSPMVHTKIEKFDLRYVYEVVGDTLESYIRCRKLNQCKALSNFIEYRNNVYKREKIGQYASLESKPRIKEIPMKESINLPTKRIKIKERQSPSPTISEIVQSPSSVISKTSEKLPPPPAKAVYIPIPSPELMRSPSPKKPNANIKLKQAPSPIPKGQS